MSPIAALRSRLAGLGVDEPDAARLGWGVLIAALLLAVYAGLELEAGVRDAQDRLDATLQRHRRLAALAADDRWTERRAGAEAALTALEDRLWPGESEGLALALVQDRLFALASDIGLSGVEVRVASAPSEPGDLRRVRAALSAPYGAAALQTLLARLAAEERLLLVESVHLSRDPVPRFELEAVAPLGPLP